MNKSKRVVILGSTGSIGDSALKVLSASSGFEVMGLTTDRNIKKLSEQIRIFRPKVVGIANYNAYKTFLSHFKKISGGPEIFGGPESLVKVAGYEKSDLVLSGVVGASGLPALLTALRHGKIVALANKESLIMAGELVVQTAKKHGAKILPVDSEHSAMFQCIEGQNGNRIHKIILTASGGPFYHYRGDLANVSVQKALAHPNWIMGRKITIDSATLMNKGLEKIEAHYLFNVPLDKIQIVIHRQSILHSAVEFMDGSILAQLSHPDMCLPIQYALTYPERKECPIKRLNFSDIKRLDFEPPDFRRFPALQIALDAAKEGGTMPAVLSAANEICVYAFLDGRIRFSEIAKIVQKVLNLHKKELKPALEEILEADRWARESAEKLIPR